MYLNIMDTNVTFEVCIKHSDRWCMLCYQFVVGCYIIGGPNTFASVILCNQKKKKRRKESLGVAIYVNLLGSGHVETYV
jgi:hypothetical protein